MTRTKALLIVLVFLVISTAYADWQVFVLSGDLGANQRRVVALSTKVGANQQSNTAALCSFRGDLQDRVTSGNEFLKTHPHGIPGIPAATLRASINGQQRTLTSLSPLRCPGAASKQHRRAAPKRHRR